MTELVGRAQAGDVDAYAQLVRDFQDMACSYGRSLLADQHLAEDAVQEAFVEAYRCLASLQEAGAFPAWLKRIVFKHCDRLTRGKRPPQTPLVAAAHVPADSAGPSHAVQQGELAAAVRAAILALPPEERNVSSLYYLDGHTQAEVAAMVDLPPSTVNNRLYAARKRLRKSLRQTYEDYFSAKVQENMKAAAERSKSNQSSRLGKDQP